MKDDWQVESGSGHECAARKAMCTHAGVVSQQECPYCALEVVADWNNILPQRVADVVNAALAAQPCPTPQSSLTREQAEQMAQEIASKGKLPWAQYEWLFHPSEDTRLLDWLEQQMPITLLRYRESECVGDVVEVGGGPSRKTLRDAVRAAIESEEPQKRRGKTEKMISAEAIAKEIQEEMRKPSAGQETYQTIRTLVIQKHLDAIHQEYEELLKEQSRITVIAARMNYNAALEDAADIVAKHYHGERVADAVIAEIRALRKDTHGTTENRLRMEEGTENESESKA